VEDLAGVSLELLKNEKKKQLINLTKLEKKYKEEGDYLG
jgi:hypothetical protein